MGLVPLKSSGLLALSKFAPTDFTLIGLSLIPVRDTSLAGIPWGIDPLGGALQAAGRPHLVA